MKTTFYVSLFTLFFLVSCSTTQTSKYTVASQNADCTGVGPQKCLLVKKGTDPNWEFFYSSIDGFNYEPGYEYVLEVKEEKLENVPADASSIKYALVKEVSKTAKTSENLPAAVIQKQNGYQCTGKVLSVDTETIGRGAAAGRFEVTVVKIQVTSSTRNEIKEGSTIHCELIKSPNVQPVVGREYVFKAKNLHPAHAKGVYMLDTNILDLVH